MRSQSLLSVAVLTTSAISNVLSFAPHSQNRAATLTPMSSQNVDEDGDDNSRRGFFKKIIGGAAITGIATNGVLVQGPSPYIPINNSLQNKLIIITGGNTGLGLESGKRLAAAGASVILTSRSAEKGARAVQTIQDYVMEQNNGQSNTNVIALPLDLCDLESVKAFPDLLKNSNVFQNTQHIDVLLNNAGVMAVPDLQITKDGYEKTFQSNHLGHFALTAGLEPLMNKAGSRVVNVSSTAHLIASDGLDFSNLNGEVEYKPWGAYGMSKLENILFTKELQKRADAAGKKITAVSLHPGAVRTDLPRYIVGEDKFISMQDGVPSVIDTLKALPLFYFTKDVTRGANSQIFLSANNGADKDVAGKFFINMNEAKLGPAALDMDKAKELWKVSEEMSGVKFDL